MFRIRLKNLLSLFAIVLLLTPAPAAAQPLKFEAAPETPTTPPAPVEEGLAPSRTEPKQPAAQALAPAPAVVGEGLVPSRKGKEDTPFWEQVLDTVGFHGYARMPLNMYLGGESEEKGGGTGGPRLPNLVDDDYYLSGFGYTRLHEKDWTQIFLSASSHNVTVTVGMYASLYSTWSQYESSEQWGIAQASLAWERKFDNPVIKRLKIKGGIFWNDFGFIQAYDTYVLGRTHQGGIQIEAEFPWVEVQFGFGAHMPLRSNNTDFTPLLYGSVKLKPPLPFTAGFYFAHEWSDDKPPLSNKEDSKMTVLGFEVKVDVPYLKGPLQIIPWAYYSMENVEFLPKALEVLHAVDGKRMMDHYLGKSSDKGDGSFPYVGAIDFPAQLWGGSESMPIFTGPIILRLFGVIAYVRSPQADPEPSKNRDQRTYLKWGFEPEVSLWPWMKLAMRYDRVIMDLYDGDNSFRAISPRLSFKPFKWGDITLLYSRYIYGSKVQLRTGQVSGGIFIPDKDVFKIQASATW